MNQILKQVDAYFEENKGEEAERFMCRCLEQAEEERDDGVQLQLLNELLGYYREVSRREKVFETAQQAIALAKRMGLENTIPYATTLLNAATGYRACGQLQESMEYYLQVQEIYDRLLEPNDMYMAGLKNNMSLLFQEMGEYSAAKKKQLEALDIAEKNNAIYEMGVTCANLAGTCMQLEERQEAYQYALKSVKLFQDGNVEDSHYAAALATLGAYYYSGKEFEKALQYYRQAMETVERNLGRNEYYNRLKGNVDACEKALEAAGWAVDSEGPEYSGTGLALARDYYETYGRPMIEREFSEYAGKIAVGLVGRGSDCFGFDDEASRDHDWGPDFCMWLTDQTWEEIGENLQQAYENLPEEFRGYRRAPHKNGRNRRGVIKISDFYRNLVGTDVYDQIDWRDVQDSSLAAAVNGKVFRDDEGIFTAFRENLQQGYPEEIRYLKLAECAARFAQTAQYNYPRMLRRGDSLTAHMMMWDGIKEALKLQYIIEGKYAPHDKWLLRGIKESAEGREIAALLEKIAAESTYDTHENGDSVFSGGEGTAQDSASLYIEQAGEFFALEMYRKDLISDTESYLDAHSEELLYKASLAAKTDKKLVEEIARLEFEAFDKVKNEGGRASCQDDWPTFYVMRSSQYFTWNRTMLLQYLYDFYREYHRGHNLIEEKYGRMMESTAPEEYEKIKSHFPELTLEKKQIIEQIVGLQVGWMEEFSQNYPALASNARKIHTTEDNPIDTSYETYLRGELGTYSDKMLELYGRYVVAYARNGRNLTYAIMENSVKMYGYKSVEAANSAQD